MCGGKIGSDGGSPIIERGACWSTSTNPTILNSKTEFGTEFGIFNISITGLKADSTYYVRAYATNSAGTAYGEQISFKTLKKELLKWTVFNTTNSGISKNDVYAVAIDSLNNKWVGTNTTNILDKFTGTAWSNYTNTKITNVHGGNLILDKKGNKWIVGDGLNQYNDSIWTNYNTANSSLPDNSIFAIAVDSNNVKWIGTKTAGLVRFKDNIWTSYNNYNSGLPSNQIYALAINKSGTIWIGTAQSGIVQFDGTNWTNFNSYNSPLPANDVYALAIDPSGNLWCGTSNGVAKYNGSTWTIYNTTNSGLSGNYIRSFGFTADGSVWIGTGGNGLSRLKGTVWTVYNTANSGLPDNKVLSIAIESNQKKIWLGTMGGGLALLELNN